MIKVAQIQFDPQLGALDQNLKQVGHLIGKCADANLIVIPELANSGYNFIDRTQAFELAGEVAKSDYVEMLRAHSQKKHQYLVSGFHEKEGDVLFNTSLLFSPDGSIGKYRKIHLFMNEKMIFQRGNLGLPVFKMDGYTLAMLICFDYLFPEIWRIVGLKGADVVAHPSNLVTYNAFKVVPAQAAINRFFIFTANRIGTEGDISFSGRSFAVNPLGDVVVEASPDQEEIIWSSIQPAQARDKQITPLNHVFNDRFPDLYKELL